MCNSLMCQIAAKGRGNPPVAPVPGGRRDPFARTVVAVPRPAARATAPAVQPRPVGPKVQVRAPAAPAGLVRVPGVPLSELAPAGETLRGLSQAECAARGGNYARSGTEESYCDTGEDAGIDCWATPRPAGCEDPNALPGKQSTSSDWNAVGTISAIGTGAAAILGAWSAYQMRERTADREDRRVEIQREGQELERQTRLAIAELQQRGTESAARVAADLQAALAQRESAGLLKTALYVGGAVVVVGVLGVVAYKVLAPRRNPSRGRKLYRRGR